MFIQILLPGKENGKSDLRFRINCKAIQHDQLMNKRKEEFNFSSFQYANEPFSGLI